MSALRFGNFVFDSGAHLLTRSGDSVHLTAKAVDLLTLLSSKAPDAVSKKEIHQRLWPDTFVSESSLTGLVAQVRKALDDDRRQERFLRTVHGFGYAFIGEVTLGGAAATARLVWEDAVFELRPGEHVLGRSEEAQVRLDAPGVSRRHARIVVTSEEATIEDLASKNGTFVGERRLEGPSALQDGDRVRLGSQLLVFRRAGAAAPTWTESPSPQRSS